MLKRPLFNLNNPKILQNSAFVLVCLASLLVFIIRLIHVDLYLINLFGIEQDEIYTLQRMFAGFPIYMDPETPPFAITQKTPIYHYISYFIGNVIGIDPDQPIEIYRLNRSTSLAFSLISISTCMLICTKLLQAPFKISAILGGLMFLSMEGHMFARPDSLFSLLFLVSIGLTITYILRQKNIYLWAAILASVLTVFVKQSGIVLPVLIISFIFFFEKKYKESFIASSLYIVSSALLVLIVNDASFGDFVSNTIGGLNNGIDLEWYYDFIYNLSIKKFALFFILGLFFSWEWFSNSSSSLLNKFLGYALVLVFVFTNIIALKWGSTPSYFSEFIHLTILSIPVYYKTIQSKSLGVKIQKLAFLLLIFSIPLLTSGKRFITSIKESDQASFDQAEKLRTYIHRKYPGSTKNWLLTDNDLLKLYFYKNAILPQEDITFTIYNKGDFNTTVYESLIREGKIPLIISKNNLSELDQDKYYMFDQFSMYYKKVEEIYGFQIYLFEKQTALPQKTKSM